MGRKTGSKALESIPRPFSKKQVKRHAEQRERWNQKKQINPTAERVKLDHVRKEISSESTKDYIAQVEASLEGSIEDLLLPTSSSQSSTRPLSLPLTDPKKVIQKLQQQKTMMLSAPIVDTAEGSPSSSSDEMESQTLDLELHSLATATDKSSSSLAAHKPSKKLAVDANSALMHVARTQDFREVTELMELMKSTNTPIYPHVYPVMMKSATKQNRYAEADALFDDLVSTGDQAPTVYAWTAKIKNVAKSGRPSEALKLIDQLLKLDAPVSVLMFNTILAEYVRQNDFDAAYKLWERMHLEPIELDKNSFSTMLVYCAKKGMPERAFFYMDEMRSLGLKPDEHTFNNLFRACGTAPHWVNGYGDIIFDAMCAMEGQELPPSTNTYNNIIRAFGFAGDPVAAEYYFWEMQRKGLPANKNTYEFLLEAYVRSQTVNASKYGTKGRYVRPPRRPLTQDEKDYQRLGSERVVSAISSGITEEIEHYKGKRTRSKLLDMLDDHPELSDEIFSDELMSDSALRGDSTASRRSAVNDEIDVLNIGPKTDADLAWEDLVGDDNVNLEELAANDPELQALIAELKKEDPTLLDEAIREVNSAGLDDDDDDDVADDESSFDYENEMMAGRGVASPHTAEVSGSTSSGTDTGTGLEESVRQCLEAINHAQTFYDPFELYMPNQVKGLEVKTARERSGIEGLVQISTGSNDEDAKATAKQLVSTLGMLDGDRVISINDNSKDLLGRKQDRAKMSTQLQYDSEDDADDESALSAGTDLGTSWDMIEFGRAPPPDYSMHITQRHKRNQKRAGLIFDHMVNNTDIKPTSKVISQLVAVHAEAGHADGATKEFARFKEYGIRPCAHTYRSLVKMHILNKDIHSAQSLKDQIRRDMNISPDKYTYGMLIESQTHRNLIVEALKNLEEATAMNLKIPNQHLRKLRARCENLGIVHPDMPADPQAWVKETKAVRRRLKNTSQSKIESVRSALR